jgi:YesN/AraC family two-component response regulator
MKRILFVDDDSALLAGLQNVLHRDRKRWEMVFANSGEVALDEIRKAPFDVVISDMRMPQIDGAMLFRILRDESPTTARIMLSGSDCESAMADIDELLAKPCNATTLRAAIERALSRPVARVV